MNNIRVVGIFEIPDNPCSVVFYPGKKVAIDGKRVVEHNRHSACAKELLSDWAMAYCIKHRFNPVFIYTTINLPMLAGFVYDETSDETSPPSSGNLMCKQVPIGVMV